MKSIFLRVLFITLFFEACSPRAEEGNSRFSEDLQPPNKTTISDLSEEQKPKQFSLGVESGPEIVSLVSQSQNGIDPPYRVELPKLRNEDGEVILDAQGDPYFLGAGGLSQFNKYTSDDGLALDAIHCAITDSRGHIWFGTNGGGLSRFDGVEFTNYKKIHGLPSITIRSIFEDSKGNIWIGTADGGLSKFDGKSFTNYLADQLGSLVIWAIGEDNEGNLWFGTDRAGVSKYDGEKFTNFSTENGLGNDIVISILKDKDGNMWFGTYGGGVSKYDGITFKTYTLKDGLSSDRIRSIFQDSKGTIWMGTLGGGLTKFDGKSFQTIGIKEGLAGSVVRSISEDKDGNIWFGTDRGASLWDGKRFKTYTTEQGLAGNNIQDMTLDSGGKMWFCTDGGGVSRLDGFGFTSFTTSHGISGNIILSGMEDQNGNLWFGSADGGISKFDGQSFTSYYPSQGLAGEIVFSILEDRLGKIWIGTAGDGLSILDDQKFTNYSVDQGLPSNEVYALVETQDGSIWIGTDNGILKYQEGELLHFTSEHGMAGDGIISILEDREGILWIGTFDGGLSRFDGKTFINFTTNQGLIDNGVNRIKEDQDGNLWIGTTSGFSFLSKTKKESIASWDPSKGSLFQSYNSQDGLPDNNVLQIVDLPGNKMAIGTNQGISIFDFFPDSVDAIQNLQIYNSDNGYPVKDLTDGQNAMFLDSKGILWAGTGSVKTGLARIDLEKISRNDSKPKLLIKQVRLNEEVISWETLASSKISNQAAKTTEELLTFKKILNSEEESDLQERFKGITFDKVSEFFPVPINLTLPYKHNHLNIEYGTNELSRPFLIEYQYILEGYDEDWSPVLKRTSATFGNIQEGDYTFKVRARYSGPAIEEGADWTEATLYSFTVLPPWYRSWWAYLGYAALFLSLLYPINIYQRNRVLKAEREKAKERELEHAKEIEKAYEDLASAHENLKATQSQLIQAEKMASLGELTAGIAHEIQNPLNFVKNFSEVSHELMDEMNQEIHEGKFDSARILAGDIKENLDRIATHSMRADAIVKAMLQHSKASVGNKELADLNAICDESLRLSYHGVRAKEKDFSAEYKTELASNIPEVEVIRQEVGRALINMCNNAFHAVHEKSQKTKSENYKPEVKIATKKTDKGVEIILSDNGMGIPEDVIGKIFQPFFTTKPTGQGTGLGLSLSYDIIKSYQGEISVKSKTGENSGTVFTIFLPTKPKSKS